MVLMGSLIKPSFSLSVSEKSAFRSPNLGEDVLKYKRWNKLQKRRPTPPMMMISPMKQIPARSRSPCVGANDRNGELCVAFSRKGSGNYLVNAAASSDDEVLGSEVLHSKNSPLETLHRNFDTFSRFSRLHIFFAKAWGLLAISLLLVDQLSDLSPLFFSGLLQVLAASFLTHVYTNGLNHLEDIEIDKINKPYRPLASGEYSFGAGVILTLSSQLMAFGLAWIVGSRYLFLFVLINFLSATAYSLNVPCLRWKSHAYLAALSIINLVVPIGLAAYLHMQTFVLGRPPLLSTPTILALAKGAIAAVVIALLKDIPDVAGDKIHGVRSFAVQFGENKVFWICVFLLQIGYLAGVVIGFTSSYTWCKFITVGGHIFLALKLWSRAKSVDVECKEETSSFYMFILKLFGVESFLIPFIR